MNTWDFSVPADDFPEPMLLVLPDGEVLAINRAAREDFGLGAGYPATHLCDLVADAGEKVMAFVRLCSSTREAVPGALSFRTPAGILDCRCDGHRTADGLVYLRCRPKDTSNQAFTVLNEKIAELARERGPDPGADRVNALSPPWNLHHEPALQHPSHPAPFRHCPARRVADLAAASASACGVPPGAARAGAGPGSRRRRSSRPGRSRCATLSLRWIVRTPPAPNRGLQFRIRRGEV